MAQKASEERKRERKREYTQSEQVRENGLRRSENEGAQALVVISKSHFVLRLKTFYNILRLN